MRASNPRSVNLILAKVEVDFSFPGLGIGFCIGDSSLHLIEFSYISSALRTPELKWYSALDIALFHCIGSLTECLDT